MAENSLEKSIQEKQLLLCNSFEHILNWLTLATLPRRNSHHRGNKNIFKV